jgi:hypothetical protein
MAKQHALHWMRDGRVLCSARRKNGTIASTLVAERINFVTCKRCRARLGLRDGDGDFDQTYEEGNVGKGESNG